MDGFTWTRHAEHGGYFRCPDGALDDMAAAGWVPIDGEPPEPPSSAVAEQLAWRAGRASHAKSKPTKAAVRGEDKE